MLASAAWRGIGPTARSHATFGVSSAFSGVVHDRLGDPIGAGWRFGYRRSTFVMGAIRTAVATGAARADH
jgi:hypothetical protein